MPPNSRSGKVSFDPQAYYNPEALNINVSTDMELGRRISAMGYEYHKLTRGAAYRMIEI